MTDSKTDDLDLAELALQTLRRALAPSEGDPSRVSLVAALYVLDGEERPDPVGGIDVGEGAEEELDSLLSHLGRDTDKN